VTSSGKGQERGQGWRGADPGLGRDHAVAALAVLVVENPAVQGGGGDIARRQDGPAAGVDDGVGGHGSSLLGPLPGGTRASRRMASARTGKTGPKGDAFSS
jgi:hypothetical protein